MLNLVGEKYWNMTVLEFVGINEKGRSLWLCKCDCGNTKVVVGTDLKRGKVKSCGCMNRRINGLYKSRLYEIHHMMMCRCYTESTTHYEYYGGRGISVCEEWRNKENGFLNFYNWSMANGYADDLTIDRIDVNGNYEPSNCRWATREQQANNTRHNKFITYKGKTMTISQWAKLLGIDRRTFDKRIKSGWSISDCIEKPVDKKYSRAGVKRKT